MNEWLKRVDVVLCRPEGSLNVGACCRAMKSMGLTNLILVSPGTFDDEEITKMAIHARDVYGRARRCESLQEALAESTLSVGVTRRRGVKRKWVSLIPEELALRASELAGGRIVLVFGNERTGLTDEELAHCNLACHIPSSPDFPSLNLSHAVQIIASTFWRQAAGDRIGRYEPVNREEITDLVRIIHESLDTMEFFKTADRYYTDHYFRDILTRATLSKKEADYMAKIFRKIQYL